MSIARCIDVSGGALFAPAVEGGELESIPFDALDRIGFELALLDAMVCVYLVCKFVRYVSSVIDRRNLRKWSIRSKLARSGES